MPEELQRTDEPRQTFVYRILRYMPNIVRDEWVNIGVLLEDAQSARRGVRLIEETAQITRVRLIHPDADQDFLRALPAEFQALERAAPADAAQYLEKMNQTLSNVVQFSPQKAVLGDDFDAELDRLFREQVKAPPRRKRGIVESTRDWIKSKVNDVFHRRRVPGLQRDVPVEEYTEPGDSFKLDYAYRNGVRGYLHALTLGRDPVQAKVLAFTAERIRARLGSCEFTAITETEPDAEKTRHRFIQRLLEDQKIEIVPVNRIEKFAEELRVRLQ